jgi:hypothetical protein
MYFEQTAGEALLNSNFWAPPSVEGIRRMRQAREDQTAAYDWQKQLLAVAATLGLGKLKCARLCL